jgi:hypothetical protein
VRRWLAGIVRGRRAAAPARGLLDWRADPEERRLYDAMNERRRAVVDASGCRPSRFRRWEEGD